MWGPMKKVINLPFTHHILFFICSILHILFSFAVFFPLGHKMGLMFYFPPPPLGVFSGVKFLCNMHCDMYCK